MSQLADEQDEMIQTDIDGDQEETAAVAQEYAPGELAPCIVTNSKVWKPADLENKNMVGCITDLVRTCSSTDDTSRRFHFMQTWEARLFDHGYQHNEGGRDGGWNIGVGGAGAGGRNGLAELDESGIYPTNIYSAQGDIATGALTRGKIKVNFTARRSKRPQDVAAAAMANDYKWLWEKVNPTLQRDMMNLGWTDSRVLVWTRSIADKRFGENEDGTPRTAEVSTAYGVLESGLPMMQDNLKDCAYAQVFEDTDYGMARAAFPWMGKKIKPGWGTFGEQEFEALARKNTRAGVIGKYLTGVSSSREVTMGYHWLRPGYFYSDEVTDIQREFLLTNFASGLFVVMAGTELCAVWDESMDDHVEEGKFARGFGQNRRSLGSSDLPLNKRINLWADLWDKFVRTAIPITLLDSTAYNAEAISELEATPRRFLPVTPPEGQTIAQTVGQTPSPVPIPGMAEMFQFYTGPLIQSIDGATPALYGGGEGADNTVGATIIRLNQSLERFGPPWQMANGVMARAAWQAVKCCADNNDEEISDSVEGRGDITVNPAVLRGGEVNCVPETAGAIPESSAQREAKILEVMDMANSNQQIASLVATPSNARDIVSGLGLADVFTVPEADSCDKQEEEIELLLQNEPLINPAWQEANDHLAELAEVHTAAKTAAAQGVANGVIPDEQTIAKGAEMEQGEATLQKQLDQIPHYLPYVPVAQDESEDHATEADTLFAWMQKPEGRAIRRKADREQPGDMNTSPNWCKWTNCFLHWQGHTAMAAKFAKAQAPPPKVSLTGKLTPDQQAQALQMAAGIQTDPASLNQPHEVETEQRAYGPAGEQVIKTKRRL